MHAVAPLLVVASAAVVLLLGVTYLLFTFGTRMLHPRDPELRVRMDEVSPILTRETTMWKTWVGFNASHSYGIIFFAIVYGYLALADGASLFRLSVAARLAPAHRICRIGQTLLV